MGSRITTYGLGATCVFRYGHAVQDLAGMFGVHRGLLGLGAPRKPERGGDPSSQRFRPDARAHAAGASAVERPKARIQAALPSRLAVAARDPVRKRRRTAQRVLHSVNGVAGWSWDQSFLCWTLSKTHPSRSRWGRLSRTPSEPLISALRCFSTRSVAHATDEDLA